MFAFLESVGVCVSISESSIILKISDSYFTYYVSSTLHVLGGRPKEGFYSVVKIEAGVLSNKKKRKIPTIFVSTEEDKYGVYSNLLFKYFLAEGVVCGHDLFVASAMEPPDNILKQWYCGGHICFPAKIAYQHSLVPLLSFPASPTTSTKFGHYYDISKTMSPELLQSIKWHSFYLPEELSLEPKLKMCNMNCGYANLLHSIQRVIYQEGFDGSHPQKKQKNILRIGIQSLGSLLWGDDICSSDTPEDIHSLTKFLYVLRGLLRKSLSACIITVPSHLIQNKAIMERVTNLSDMVVGLESFIGSERETNPLYKDYHGLLHVHQIPRLNSLICDVSDTKDLAFRLKRKQFTIERLHLPPDLSDTVSRSSKQDLAESAKLLSSGCGAMAIGKKHLDF
uniref:Elongator complex protein 4 n=1 Tax=Anser cygnoides TaxID=8845 RepID=A0A8B9EDW6_ANSCY